MLHRLRVAVLAGAMLMIATDSGRAADVVRYGVTIVPTGDKTLDGAVGDSATLVSLRESAPVGPSALIARARSDADRFAAVLRSLGHYAGEAKITIAGHALDDATLPDVLDAMPSAQEAPVVVTLTPGPVFHLRRVTLTGDAAGARIPLAPGDPAVASAVLGAGAALADRLRQDGHAMVRVDPPVVDLDRGAEAIDVSFNVNAGPRVVLGAITVTGLEALDESYVRRRLMIAPGQAYDPTAIDNARADMAKVDAIASVRLRPAEALAPDGTLPIEVAISERKLHAFTVGAAYSTDQGGIANVSWTHRNLFGAAESLVLSAAVTQLGASAAKQPGYNVGAQFTIPDWYRRDQSLSLSLLAIRESLDAYDRTAAIASAAVTRRLAEHLTGSVGVTFERAHIVQEDQGRDYSLIQLPLGLRYDTTTSLLDPISGIRANASLTPTHSALGAGSNFAIAQISGSTYINLAAPGRSVLALRALLGTVQGAKTFDIPPDQRFYAGGSSTVRGYKFQSVGPRFADNKPIGGTSIFTTTAEYRQRFGESWGAAVFVDAGQVSGGSAPGAGKLLVGAGLGVRYYTSIGPIRIDVAAPMTKQRGGDIGELYIGLGQAF